jgi:uncharacterized protein YciI
MQFLVLGYDGSDEKALERRMAVREQHLAGSRRMYAADRWLYSGAILDDEGTMIGSFVVCDFASREELESMWLGDEPYVLGGVWKRTEIHPVHVSPRAPSGPERPAGA